MKKILYLFAVMTLMLSGCQKLNDKIDRVDNKVNHLEGRVDVLEELCKQMNTNISSLQTLVKALQQNDYVTGVTPITKNGEVVGYTISFTKSEPITIYHGNNGEDGKNGSDGADGHTPQIGVKQDSDGIYYWTVDGEWLLDDSDNKVKAVGIDGKDGENGTDGKDGQDGSDGKDGQDGTNGADGITPQLKIENDYWYISYDNGDTWNQLGQATGADGIDGEDGVDGDSMFSDIDCTNDDFVIFTLSDGTQIQLPTWYAFEQLQKLCNQMNTNIASLQTIVGALQNNDYVQSITPLMENGKEVGYTITFTKSGAVTIYHGKDSANGNDGQNGTNGVDGKDGHTPQIGVKQDTDGIYYWTVDGEWLLEDNGNKIKAVGTDGKDGQDGANGNDGQNGTNGTDGTDGITPELKIENSYWYVSYDDGATWKQLGKATGEQGPQGNPGVGGDSMFTNIDYSDTNYVVFYLSNGSQFKLPTWYAFEQLQKLCNQMNTNIASLQTIIGALQNNDYVQSITPLMENGKEVGYTITFTKSGAVTIYHGKDGKDGANGNDGQNGTNGIDGKDGHTPQIGVKQDADGVYYWTVDGEWLLDDNGNKIKAVGTDGKDGQDGANGNNGQNGADGTDGTNGADGITPELKIENGYWYVSYDDGATWKQLGKATGEQGPQGNPGVGGDSMFTNIDYSDTNYVVFYLSNGSQFKLPTWYAFEQLQKLCNQMNTNIASLQTIVGALQNNDYVQSITPLMENGKEVGYTITFTKSGAVTIYHGKDGKDGANGNDGQNGTNGVDGKDGHTPTIGVKQDADGGYYWTVDGEWLLDDNGNKIKAVGTDGKDGQDGANGNDGQNGTNGTDGITPELKIENGYWYVSYDEGATWKQLGKAAGEDGQDGTNGTDGKDGQDGDSFFQGVDTSNSDYVILTLADGTEIKLPTWYAFEQLQKLCNQMNTNIASLQTIVGALQNNDYIQSITPLMENGKEVGYIITFTKSGAVTIYHGKDGANGNDGQNGTNGVDGKDGHTPQIGVKQDTDGIYYWTVDGEWLLDDNGNKIKAVGTDGKDGQDGTNGNDGQNGADGSNGTNGIDGITPELKIEGGYWYVSYNEGATWKQLGKATGEDGLDGTNGTDGKDGQDGDSFFQSVTEDASNVYIILADGTTITIPKSASVENIELTYIPRYSDGKATVFYTEKSDSYVELDFEVSPISAALHIASNWQSWATVKAVYTETRAAVSLIDMPIISCTADLQAGIITVKASGKNLSDDFFLGAENASARLSITIDDAKYTSDYVPMVIYTYVASMPAHNEIWYISSNGNIISPYETDVFGAKIISNTYKDGKGVILFDKSVNVIGEKAFYNSQYLMEIVLPSTVEKIGKSAFASSVLEKIEIPDSVTTIEDSAFSGCQMLKKVTIGSGVEQIGATVFAYCYRLYTIISKPTTPPKCGSEVFKNSEFEHTASGGVLYVPIGSKDAYSTATGWRIAREIIEKEM